jgi:acetyl esterase/lipase
MMPELFALPPARADVRVSYGEAPQQFGDLWLPNQPSIAPVVVAIHGGFWLAEHGLDHLSHVCQALCREGFVVWSLEYRRVGDPGGGFPGTLEDVASGAGRLRGLCVEYGFGLSRWVTLGNSAGGQLALWLAARTNQTGEPRLLSRPKAAIALAGVCDLANATQLQLGDGAVCAFLGTDQTHSPRYAEASPSARLPLGVRQLLIHGTDDPIVPVEQSRAHVERAAVSGDDATLLELPGTGHFELIDPRTAQWQTMLPALRAVITGAAPAAAHPPSNS